MNRGKIKVLFALTLSILMIFGMTASAFAEIVDYVAKDDSGNVYVYNGDELVDSYIEGGKLWSSFLDGKVSVAVRDDTGKYVDADAIVNAYIEGIDPNDYVADANAEQYAMPEEYVEVTVGEDGELVETPITEPPVKELTVVSVGAIEDINVDFGTAVEAITFPTKVALNLSDETTVEVDATFACDNYDGNVAGEYVFTATYELPEGVTGDKPAATVKVVVAAKPLLAVESVSAINANAIGVNFNKAIENTAAATFAVKRGTVTEDVAVTWNEAKTEATLTKSGNFVAGEYTVTVSGVETAEGKNTGTVTFEAEAVKSIEIVTEQLQKSTTAPLAVNFLNQYGKKATVPASNQVTITAYNTTDSTRTVVQPAVNKYELNALAANVGDKIQVTVIYKGLTATKTLDVVSAATVGAVNLVAPTLPEGKDKFTEAGTKNVEVKYTATNTLGEEYKLKATDKDSTVKFYTSDDQILNLADVSIDAEGKIKIAKFGTKAGEVTLTAIATATGNSSAITINVQQNEGAPSTVELEKNAVTFAAGSPTTAKQYVAVTIKDNYGKVIVTKDLKSGDYVVSSDNSDVAVGTLILTGENAGKIEIAPGSASVTKGQSATITVLVKATGQKATITATASEAAVPTAIDVKKNTTVPSSLLVGAVNDIELVVKDQYGLDITTGTGYTVDYTTSDATIVELSNKVTGLTNPKVTATAKKAGSVTVKAQLKKDSVVQAEKAFAITVVPNDSTKVTYEVTDIPTLYKSAGTLTSINNKATALANGYFAEFNLVARDASGNVSSVPASAVLGTPTTAMVPTPGEATPGTWAAGDVKVFNDAGKWYIGVNKSTLVFPKDAASKDLDLKGKVRFTVTSEGDAKIVEKEFTISKDDLKATEIKLVKDTDATTKAAIDTTNPTKLFRDVVDATTVDATSLAWLDTAANTDTYFVVVKDQFGVYALAQTTGSAYNTVGINPVNPKGYEDAGTADAVTLTSGALTFANYGDNYLTANNPSFQAVVTHATLAPITINVKSAETATATADVTLALTNPTPDANNTITGGGADKAVVVKVAKNTSSVVLTGTFASGQVAAKGGADVSDVTIDATTPTAPTFTVDTTSVKDGGSKTFTIIVKEAAKGNITYNVTVTVAAS